MDKKPLVIIHKAQYAYLSGSLKKSLHEELQQHFAWVSPTDLTDIIPFYQSNRWMHGGIVQDVAKYLRRKGVGVSVVYDKNLSSRKYDWKMLDSFKYREGQELCVNKLYDAQSGVLEATMGFGKTVIFAVLACKIGKPTLIVTHQGKPLQQVMASITHLTTVGKDLGVWGQSMLRTNPLIVATMQTISSVMKSSVDTPEYRWLKDTCKVLIMDELHHAGADGPIELLNTLDSLEHLYGGTGTYRREDDREQWLYAMYGPPVHTVNYADTINSLDNVPIEVRLVPVPPKNYGMQANRNVNKVHRNRQYQKVKESYIVYGETGRNQLIADTVKEERKAQRTMAVIVSSITHADILQSLIPRSATIIGSGPGKTSQADRVRLFDQLAHREIDCVISTVMDEAVDVPSLDTVIIAAGGKSSVKMEQRLRSTRGCNKELRTGFYAKKKGYVYYYLDKADFLTNHSRIVCDLLYKIVKSHPANTIFIKEQSQWTPYHKNKQELPSSTLGSQNTKKPLKSMFRK